jgi:hypothetical protein
VALSRLTRGGLGGSFTLDARIAFGDGCDWPSYMLQMISESQKARNAVRAHCAIDISGSVIFDFPLTVTSITFR